MAGDLVAMCEPVTKWSTMVQRPLVAAAGPAPRDQDRGDAADGAGLRLPAAGHPGRAGRGAGPADLASPRRASLPHAGARSRRRRRCSRPARAPVIFVGDGVAFSGAQDELTRVAELLGAEVWEADAGEVNMR